MSILKQDSENEKRNEKHNNKRNKDKMLIIYYKIAGLRTICT